MQYQLVQRKLFHMTSSIKSMFTSLTIRAMAIARIVFRSNEFVRLPPNDVSLAKGWSNGPKGEHAIGILSADKPVFDLQRAGNFL